MKRSMSGDSSKPDRKTVEKNRRTHMKDLCFKLAALIPHRYLKSYDKDNPSQQDQLDQAICYIRHLRERVERLKDQKDREKTSKTSGSNVLTHDHNKKRINGSTSKLPIFELRDLGSVIKVTLISGLTRNFMLCEVISILEQEGAEVVSASLAIVGDMVFHTIHAQVEFSRLGVETSRANQRLQDLIYRPKLVMVDLIDIFN